MDPPEGASRPLDSLHPLAVQHIEVTEGFEHVEIFTMKGLLTMLRHGGPGREDVVVMCGGAMGGLLGPADGLYHDLGVHFAEQGIGTVRVSYRRANDMAACVHDLCAAADFAARTGAKRFVLVGHSFGGAVAINAAIALHRHAVGVVTLATQSAGCEGAAELGDTPLLLLHGDRDELLPPMVSEVVQTLAGGGELVILPGTGHLMNEAGDELRDRLSAWIPARFE